ncbi:MAG: NADH dehydrogenase subunit [Saprospiraceae bacterium]|nr:MAG: NADH dehydrogenase subunit [Saprospiraceae bacterium]
MKYHSIKNNETCPLSAIPELGYDAFLAQNTGLLAKLENHVVSYFGVPEGEAVRVFSCIANDATAEIYLSSTRMEPSKTYPSLSKHRLAFQKFEREIHENYGVGYSGHPWLKPLRFPFNRTDKASQIANYPFFRIESEELHEVGVGPIHAGIIEPGHFRFICNGEQIWHLEIQLGFQHRGVEALFLQKEKLLQRHTLAEGIAGDTVAGHTTAFVNLWESLAGFQPGEDLRFARTLALELERLAVHTGDLSAMCTDVAYQLGSAVFGRLRTPLINFFQEWCGNRFAKGLIRAGYSNFPFTPELGDRLRQILDAYEPDYLEMCRKTFTLPSVQARFERTGVVSEEDAWSFGAVGMAARTSCIARDVRASHPHDGYLQLAHKPVVKHHGDVYSRAQMRRQEIRQSLGYIRQLLEKIPAPSGNRMALHAPAANAFSLSLVEGWRGEICHCAITGPGGKLQHYKVKDPSFHNWLAVAMSVRNNEISDFPICNKSFDLSYCGHDL